MQELYMGQNNFEEGLNIIKKAIMKLSIYFKYIIYNI